MDAEVYSFITSLHASKYRCVLLITGAGSKALSWLLEVPGSSRTLVEATIPYSTESLSNLLGYSPKSVVSMRTAQYMAYVAFCKAKSFVTDETSVIGLSCTATIATDRNKKGKHRAHISTFSHTGVKNWILELQKDIRTRVEEEESVSLAILAAISDIVDIDVNLDINVGPSATFSDLHSDYGLSELFDRNKLLDSVYVDIGAQSQENEAIIPKAILSGSFDPIHSGHISLLKSARKFLKTDVIFELSMTNVDKPDLTIDETVLRINQIFGRFPIFVTRSDSFNKKAKLFPGCVFVVGYDTALRIIDPRYYDENIDMMKIQLSEIRDLGCSFLVAARSVNGKLLTLNNLAVPTTFNGMFNQLPAKLFREDISSTELRSDSLNKER